MAHSLLAYKSTMQGLARVEPDTSAMRVSLGVRCRVWQALCFVGTRAFVALQADLDKSWEVLTEPVQTVMKRYGYDDAYEALK